MVNIPTLLTYLIALIFTLNITVLIVFYKKFKKLLPAIAYFLLTVSDALTDNQITDEEWEAIIAKAKDIWDIISGATDLLIRKDVKTKGRSNIKYLLKYKDKWNKI